ncbi:hypothetical protein GYMLUDRAFT_173317, partial [Collybiopsis luxurians FD-317 M1]
VLDFVRQLFLHIAPNYAAWCSAVTNFLGAQGYHLPGNDPLRQRFSNALQWFITMQDVVNAKIQTVLHEAPLRVVLEACSELHCHIQFLHTDDEASASSNLPHSSDSDSAESIESQVETLGTPFQCPSEYLHSHCPLCFGPANT